MKEQNLIFLLAIVTLISCSSDKKKINDRKQNKLVGTWKLIEYADFDTVHNRWTYPYGEHPKGYFTYTQSGVINLNGSAEKPLDIPPDSEYQTHHLRSCLRSCLGVFWNLLNRQHAFSRNTPCKRWFRNKLYWN